MNNNNRKFIERFQRLKIDLQLKEKYAMRIYPYTNHWYINKQNKHTHTHTTTKLDTRHVFWGWWGWGVVVVGDFQQRSFGKSSYLWQYDKCQEKH